MSNLAVRILSALVMALVGISGLALTLQTRWMIVALVLVLGTWEFSRMLCRKYAAPSLAWYPALLVLLLLLPRFPGFPAHPVFAPEIWSRGLAIWAVLSITVLGFRHVDIASMAPWIFLNLFGCAFFGLYSASLLDLMGAETGLPSIYPFLTVIILIATADTGAYFTGRAFGKHKLCPTISKGKTLEGAVGGAVLTMAVALGLGTTLLGLNALAGLGLGLLMALTAIVGDLFISILKRHADFKDSSHLLPGHGGVLDRFDALLYSAPVAAFYLHLIRG